MHEHVLELSITDYFHILPLCALPVCRCRYSTVVSCPQCGVISPLKMVVFEAFFRILLGKLATPALAGRSHPDFILENIQGNDEAGAVSDPCSELETQPKCDSASGCRWHGGSWLSWKAYCHSTCLDHIEADCPGVQCRWQKSWNALQRKCVPRLPAEACDQLQDQKRCGKQDCSWLDTETTSSCLPKCHRYNPFKCPGQHCEVVEGVCRPKSLAKSTTCTDLEVDQCETVLGKQCKLMPVPFHLRLIGVRQVCEPWSSVMNSTACRKDRDCFQDLLPGCKMHTTRDQCQRPCEWRTFKVGDGESAQRCTVDWDSDMNDQAEIVKKTLKWQNNKEKATSWFLWSMGAGGSLALVFMALHFIFHLFVSSLAGGIGYLAAGSAYNVGAATAAAAVAAGTAFPPAVVALLAIAGLAAILLLCKKYLYPKVMQWMDTLIFTDKSLRWEDVTASSGVFCQEVFADVELENPSAVRTVHERLLRLEPGCVRRLTHNKTLGRISQAAGEPRWMQAQHKVCKDLCIDLVDAMHHNMAGILLSPIGTASKATLLRACAVAVLQPVESHILGCCERSCGWNSATNFCDHWPFMTSTGKATWLEECCTEYQVVDRSVRQIMCNSMADLTSRRR